MAIPKQIITSGNVYIKYEDEDCIAKAQIGDIKLYLNNDATSTIVGDYENMKFSGYFKCKIFDGLVWHHMDITEICTRGENKFAKKQKPIDTAYLCKSIIEQHKGTILNKTYRGHFSIKEYIPDPYARRHPKWNKIKAKS
ncbi:MAG: hypothetical protein K0R02_616 [Rickettsiaceae bacterium]|jgi:hypothetical protein|nr:hypothetical protein [Rickettsiaceae bacterium]